MTTKKELEIEEARKNLREIVKPGDVIYTVLKHVSQSGMSRVIDLHVMRDNEPRRISWNAAKLLEGYDYNHEGCKAGGCGMDMGFHLVYNLSCELFYDYECLGESCPSNEHVNNWKSPRGTGVMHHDGYCLKQRWL